MHGLVRLRLRILTLHNMNKTSASVFVFVDKTLFAVNPTYLDLSLPEVSLIGDDPSDKPKPMKITATGGQPSLLAISDRKQRAAALREFRRLLGYSA